MVRQLNNREDLTRLGLLVIEPNPYGIGYRVSVLGGKFVVRPTLRWAVSASFRYHRISSARVDADVQRNLKRESKKRERISRYLNYVGRA